MGNCFKNTTAKILDNDKLREPQKFAYLKAYEYYNDFEVLKDRETIIVLPTGTGKTGLIGILPYGISNGRVLIITPQLTIKKGILENLTSGPNNFYLNFDIFDRVEELPIVAEYQKKIPVSIYNKCDIVVVNIHKLQERFTKSLLKHMPKDFFDLIIIDEGHHSTAKTWIDAIQYFDKAKIIKLTGTPFRADGEIITGTEIYKYPLSSAMTNKYVKSLRNIVYVPNELYFTIDGKNEKYYSFDEITAMKLKDDEWITRSVAYSKECSEQVIKKSLSLLKKKKEKSDIPHKIIAVACSVKHAEEIKEIYEEYGVKAAIIHSKMEEKELENNFKSIENNRVEVVINIAMLGEGYDHKYLSIAAIFRPFRNLGAYAQFVGRILRYIPDTDLSTDNIGEIIAHKGLNLQSLWEYYRKEVEKSNISKKLNLSLKEAELIDISHKENIKKTKDTGDAKERGIGSLEIDAYINTEILMDAERQNEEDRKKIRSLIEALGITEEEAKDLVEIQRKKEEAKKHGLNRPDLLLLNNKQMFDKKIKEEIIPELLCEFKYDINEKTLENCSIFKYNNNKWIAEIGKTNGAILAVFISSQLNKDVGKKREEWDDKDFKKANEVLPKILQYLKKSL